MNKTKRTIITAPRKPAQIKQKGSSLNFTQKTDYGIVLLTTLAKKTAKKNQFNSIKKIAEEKDLSFPFLQKTAGHLQRAGLIKAERGKYGGYKLSKSAKKISLKQIIEALEGPIAIVSCLKNPCMRKNNCLIKSGLKKINNELLKFLSSKTLDKLIL